MITFTEVLHQIAADILYDKSGVRYDFNMCITDNIKQSEEDFTKRYGPGKSYHFPIESYEHGKQLAIAIYRVLTGNETAAPDSNTNDTVERALYLYVYLSPIQTV